MVSRDRRRWRSLASALGRPVRHVGGRSIAGADSTRSS